MISTADFEKGMVIKYDGQPWEIKNFSFYKPGKGGAFMQTKMQNLNTGATIEKSFKSQEKFEELDTERGVAKYVYHNDKEVVFSNKDNSRFSLDFKLIGDQVKFLKSNMEVGILFVEDRPVSITIPVKIEYVVKTSPPAIKGNSIGSATKGVVLDNGLEMQAPMFIETGDIIVVNTERGEYVERKNKN